MKFTIYPHRELVGFEEIAWHNLRGTHMIAACKMISIAYDVDRSQMKRVPRFLEFWGYILCPGNVILGPWHSFSDYLKTFQRTDAVSTSNPLRWKKIILTDDETITFFCSRGLRGKGVLCRR